MYRTFCVHVEHFLFSFSDPRALCHVAGTAPNKWGLLRDGTDVREKLGIFPLSAADAAAAERYFPYCTSFLGEIVNPSLTRRSFFYYVRWCRYQDARFGSFGGAAVAAAVAKGEKISTELHNLPTAARRSLPLWPAATLALCQEVLNRRLFSEVRERRGLTYDANFQLTAHERLAGGWWLVTVTSSPANSQAALEACVDSLLSIVPDSSKPFGAADPLSRANLVAAQVCFQRLSLRQHLA